MQARAAEIDLPAPLTAFIGREREVGDVAQLVSQHRLVTITGAGGSGKSRLALEVARRLAGTTAGEVRWTELAPLGRGDLLAEHIAAQLHVQERPDRGILDSIFEALQPPLRVLVLDNCEHVVEEAASFVSALLQRCGQVRVLTTSREALGVDGERSWLLRGLALEPAQDSADRRESEAVQLFTDRAAAAAKDFRPTDANGPLIHRICTRLDGLPLAIELAAARVGALALDEIVNRLDDVFALLTKGSRSALPRHRTLKATVDWSYQLITPREQELLQRLAVFSGAFALEAAEQVCSDDAHGSDSVVELVANLVTRSLVTMHEESGIARYSLLEIIRQYAEELVAKHPERHRSLKRRHALYYASLAVEALPLIESHPSPAATGRFAAEYDNMRAALHWSFASGERELGHILAGALWRYWGQTWQLSEAEHWWNKALAGPEPAASQHWGQVLHGAGTFLYVTGQLDRARDLLGKAADVLGRTGDRPHESMALSTLAHLCCTQHRFDEALGHAEKAAAIARELPEAWPLCHAMSNGLGLVYQALGRYDLVQACHEEALAKARPAGANAWGVAMVARASAQLALDRGRCDAAREHAAIAIAAVQSLIDPHLSMRVLLLAERILNDLGRHAAAAQITGTIAAARRRGMLILSDDLQVHDELCRALRQSLGEWSYSEAAAVGAAQTAAEALVFAAEQMASMDEARHRQATVAVAVSSAPAELKVRALGTTEVTRNETRLLDGSGHPKCVELLAYLLSHPDGRTRDQVGVAFWPDASAAQLKNNFHVLLHKLRKGLGDSDLVVASNGSYKINSEVRVWFDAAVFERETLAALRELRSAATSARLEAALDLYRGAFLERTAGGDWVSAQRDRLQLLFIRGLSALADLQMQSDAVEAATATLERLIRIDDLHEASWRRLMTCLERRGQRDLALRQYRSLAQRLRQQLGVEPEPATQALARRLSTPQQR